MPHSSSLWNSGKRFLHAMRKQANRQYIKQYKPPASTMRLRSYKWQTCNETMNSKDYEPRSTLPKQPAVRLPKQDNLREGLYQATCKQHLQLWSQEESDRPLSLWRKQNPLRINQLHRGRRAIYGKLRRIWTNVLRRL